DGDAVNLREKVGQLFMLGFQGTELTEDLRALCKTYHPGGVILFSRNLTDPEQAARLTNALQTLAPNMPLLMPVHQDAGHGATPADSAKELPTVSHGLDRLHEIELRPFVHCFQNGLAAVMTAHVRYPALDPEHPATLSQAILTDLLRTQLQFKGLVLTDD